MKKSFISKDLRPKVQGDKFMIEAINPADLLQGLSLQQVNDVFIRGKIIKLIAKTDANETELEYIDALRLLFQKNLSTIFS